MNSDGPTRIPEHRVTVPESISCWGCKYLQHKLWRSGRDPEYIDICNHPDALDIIPDADETPEWCPFLKKT